MKHIKSNTEYLSKYNPPEQVIDKRVNKDLLSDLFLEYADKWGLKESENVLNPALRSEEGSYTMEVIAELYYYYYTLYIYIPETSKCVCESDISRDFRGNPHYTLKDEFFDDMDRFLSRLSAYGLKRSTYNGTSNDKIYTIFIK